MSNPLKTKADLQQFLFSLLDPLAKHTSPGGALVTLGYTGTHYDARAADLEGFSRPLWGLASFLAGGGSYDGVKRWLSGFANGTNPNHDEFWGNMKDKDQRMVECAAIGYSIAVAQDKLWDPLDQVARQNFEKWLGGMNDKVMPDTNWLWFRVFANLGLSKVGSPHFDKARLTADLDHLDTFYLSGGWSRDGPEEVKQIDYYSSSFAIQFAQLVYSKVAEKEDPDRSKEYKNRARQFALDFVHYFDEQGRAIPFGRSMTYRYAQASFWGAVAFADVELPEPLTWGVVKGILLRNLRWWQQQPYLSPEGIVTIGYGYPNGNMTENYNSPGSPYWCCKSFAPLALPESHPFWAAEEERYPHTKLPITVALDHPLHLVTRSGGHTFLLSSGQMCAYPLRHSGAKYGKFAYSSAFGFSVPTGNGSLEELGGDNVLSLSDDAGETWKVRRVVVNARIEHEGPWLRSLWYPWKDTEVETWLVPPHPDTPLWHVRVHRVRTKRQLLTAEGAFAIYGQGKDWRALDNTDPLQGEGKLEKPGLALAASSAGACGIIDLGKGRKPRTGEALRADANTNLMTSRTVLPTLKGKIIEDVDVWLAAAVFAAPAREGETGAPVGWQAHWAKKPVVPAKIAALIG